MSRINNVTLLGHRAGFASALPTSVSLAIVSPNPAVDGRQFHKPHAVATGHWTTGPQYTGWVRQ